MTRWLFVLLTTLALTGCASGPPTPDWVPTTITPAEQAEAECRQSPEVAEARKGFWCMGLMCLTAEKPETRAMEACMALKGFKRS
jgi:hypothetical protein